MVLGFEKNFLKSKNALLTGEEIIQQPDLWMETLEVIKNEKEKIKSFFSKLDLENSKIIFTGAGTSEFVGNTLVPYMRKVTNLDMESRATTDIVANPKEYIHQDKKIILVSFARSGNSPESVAAVEIADKISKNIHHIFITCNPQGKLAKKTGDNLLTLLMPEKSNDQGFAMTGSFTCMLLAAMLIFKMDNIEKLEKEIKELSEVSKKNILDLRDNIFGIAEKNIERIVFLGGGSLKGIAQESSLKLLELCAGKIPSVYDTPLGFRHGPKSIVNSETAIVNFVSQDKYASQYDVDLIKELVRDQKAKYIISVGEKNREEQEIISLGTGYCSENEILVSLNYVLIAQIFAFVKSLEQSCTPDNPCPTGEVNRVVQGVIIHNY